MTDNCFVCYSKGKNGKTLWGCNKCNFLVCAKCSSLVQNVRTCSRCREKTDQPQSGATVNQSAVISDLPLAYIRRVAPQEKVTPGIIDQHLLHMSGGPTNSVRDTSTSESDKKAIAEIERRLRRLQGVDESKGVHSPKCGMCNAVAVFRCNECLARITSGVQEMYCTRCLTITHSNNDEFVRHKPVQLQ